jgi:DMSO reductase anchor subunit
MVISWLGLGMLASLAHLGTKRNAWRVFANLRRSSLSKEVFFTGLFGMGVLFALIQVVLLHEDAFPSTAFAAIAGLGLVYNMAQVYRLPAAPGWNTWQTNAGFFISALLLGISVMKPILGYESIMNGIQIPAAQQMNLCLLVVALLSAQWLLMRGQVSESPFHQTRKGLILFGIGITVASLFLPLNFLRAGMLLLVIVLSEEILGRWLFYRSRLKLTS